MSAGRRRATATGRWRGHRWRDLVLDVGATLGVLSVLAAVAFAALGVTPLVFRSGSMSPAIDAGSLALAKETPADDVREGDVVSVVSSTNVRITHRVVSTATTAAGTELTLKGDANSVADAERYQVGSVDRVVLSVPRLGYVVDALAGPLGMLLGGAVVAGVLVVLLAPGRPVDGPSSGRGGSRRATSTSRRAGVAAVALVMVGAGAAAQHPVRGTLAEFKDDASAQSGTIAAATVPTVAGISCANAAFLGVFSQARISWTSAGAPYSYLVEVRRTGTTPTIYSTTVTATTVDIQYGNLAPAPGPGVNLTVSVRAFPTGAAAYTSTTAATTPVRTRTAVGNDIVCGAA